MNPATMERKVTQRRRPRAGCRVAMKQAATAFGCTRRLRSVGIENEVVVQGTRFRALTVVDVFTKECLAIEVGQSLKGEHVVAVLKGIAAERGSSKTIFCDNGSGSSVAPSICGLM